MEHVTWYSGWSPYPGRHNVVGLSCFCALKAALWKWAHGFERPSTVLRKGEEWPGVFVLDVSSFKWTVNTSRSYQHRVQMFVNNIPPYAFTFQGPIAESCLSTNSSLAQQTALRQKYYEPPIFSYKQKISRIPVKIVRVTWYFSW